MSMVSIEDQFIRLINHVRAASICWTVVMATVIHYFIIVMTTACMRANLSLSGQYAGVKPAFWLVESMFFI